MTIKLIIFARKYQGVYNSVPIDESDMSNIKCEINRRLVTENNVDIACVDSGKVHEAIKRLNAGKNDGDFGMYSNHILLANDTVMKHISNLFSMMLSHGLTPEDMIRAVITSIPKNVKESVACSENYRGIAFSSIPGKVFDLIIIQRYVHALSSSDLQFSFKKRDIPPSCAVLLFKKLLLINYKTKVMYMPACWMQQKPSTKSVLLNCLPYFSNVIFQLLYFGSFWTYTQDRAWLHPGMDALLIHSPLQMVSDKVASYLRFFLTYTWTN